MDNSAIKTQARTDLLGNWTAPVMNTFSLIVFMLLLNTLISSLTANRTSLSAIIIGYIASFTTALITSILLAGYLNIFLYVSRRLDEMRAGEQPDPERRPPHMFSAVKMQPDRFIIIAMIYEAANLVLSLPALLMKNTALQLIWLAAATVIIYAVFLNFSQSFFLLLDDPGMGALDAMRESAFLMRGNKKRLFLLHLSFIGWACLGVLSLFIGFLWIIPYMVQSLTRFYMTVISDS